jgi:hypothetical protein
MSYIMLCINVSTVTLSAYYASSGVDFFIFATTYWALFLYGKAAAA